MGRLSRSRPLQYLAGVLWYEQIPGTNTKTEGSGLGFSGRFFLFVLGLFVCCGGFFFFNLIYFILIYFLLLYGGGE